LTHLNDGYTIQAYQDAIHNVALSGPTLFAPLLQQATAIAASANCSQQNQKYSVLLILTDGIINDMEATIAAVVAASNQPLSIIIVGVGNEDFSCELNELLLFSS
jgi:Mg-chelatase subunit ChlD